MSTGSRESAIARLRRRWTDAQPFLETSKRKLVALAVASVTAGFLEAGALLLLVQLALAISSGESSVDLATGPFGDSVEVSVTSLILLSLFIALLRFGVHIVVAAYLPSRMSADAQAHVRAELFDAFTQASWDLQSREREGSFQEVLVGQVNRSTQAVMILSDALAAAFNFAALMVSALILNPPAAISILILVSGLFVGLRPLMGRARRLAARRSLAYLNIAESATEAVRVAEEVQVFDVSDAQRALIDERSAEIRNLTFRSQFLARLLTGLYQTLALLMLVGGLAALHAINATGVATLGAIVLIMVRAMSYSQVLQTTYHRLNDTAPDMALVRRALRRYRDNARVAGTFALPKQPLLAFEQVFFEYRRDVPVLRNVSFAVPFGETVGVIGPSGAGKSTLVQLFLRLRVPTAGRLAVSGLDAEDVSLTEWRRAVAYVPQDGRLISGTVSENIAFYRDLPQEQIEAAARLAGVHEDISDWPAGYGTMIGQRADAVSGGQRQRLTIARALVGGPSILVLDEPTSALDVHSEVVIHETLERLKGHVTVVIIAHRMSTLASCDRLLVFDHGNLQASGTALELLESSDFYRKAIELSQLS